MRVVLGISLTGTSAVWALVDTKDGHVLADEIVQIESLNEIARAAARSVQNFDAQTEHDVEGVRMTWTDDAHAIAIRLRTKLRLAGFEVIESVAEHQARENRNKTARHIAPHLVLAYGAARTDPAEEEAENRLLRRLVARVPLHVPEFRQISMLQSRFSTVQLRSAHIAAAASVAVALIGVVLYAALWTPSAPDVDTTVAEPPAALPVAPAPAAPPPLLPAPQAAVEPVAPPTVTPTPAAEPAVPVAAWQPATAAIQPEIADEPVVEVAEQPLAADVNTAEPQTIPAVADEPHLTDAQPLAGPVPAPAVAPLPAPAPQPPAPSIPSPLNILFSALP